jgi:Asp-tRNA(Asn)/Glu-tRNA(Gln) amidotransferase A subunit family amidase
VADSAILFEALTENNPSSAEKRDTKTFRIGIPRTFFFEDLDPEVAKAVETALQVLSNITAESREIEIEVDTDRVLQAAESYAVHAEWIASSSDLYHPETLRRLLGGKDTPHSEVVPLQKNLEIARQEIQRIFRDVDLLVTPTTPIPAPNLAELQVHPDKLRPSELVLLRNTRPFNVWGLPAISVPCGFTKAGLPMGLQIAGAPGREDMVLQLAQSYESETEWHKHHPQLT